MEASSLSPDADPVGVEKTSDAPLVADEQPATTTTATTAMATTTTTTTTTPPPPTDTKPPPQYLFPPFPLTPPENATAPIIPFSKFKEYGIQIFADPESGIELDGLGIPTVRLRVPHDTDVRKTDARGFKGDAEGGGAGGEGEGGEGEGDGDGEGEGEEGVHGRGTSTSSNKKRKKKKKKKQTLDADGSVSVTSTPAARNRNQKNVKLPVDLSTITDPVERALEEKRQRLLLFAQQEWWEQWEAGEDLRRGRTYDSSLTPIDRIHMAATDFRTGRIWPPASTNVRFLWDQFRLYVGLLGSPPVWKRTDIPNYGNSDSDDNDVEADDYDSFLNPSNTSTSRAKPNASRRAPGDSSDDEILHTKYSDEEDELDGEEEGGVIVAGESAPKSKPSTSASQKKRIPPRAPYALFYPPPAPTSKNSSSNESHPSQILVSHPSQITVLLSLSTTLRQTRLLNFLADPATVVAEFLSSYLYAQGLVWGSPARMIGIGRLVLFWLEFMKRCGVLSDSSSSGGGGSREARYRDRGSERELGKAIAIAQKAVGEIPKAGWVVRMCPDELVGRGCRALWGTRWRVEGDFGFDFDFETLRLGGDGVNEGDIVGDEEEDIAARLKRFEDELRAENVQLFSADPVELGVPPLHREGDEEDEPIVIETKTKTAEPLSTLSSTATIVAVDDEGEDAKTMTEAMGDTPDQKVQPPPISPLTDDVTRSSPDPPLPSAPSATSASTTASTPIPTQQQQKEQHARSTAQSQEATRAAALAWLPPREQALFAVLGSMSAFPVLHTAGGWDALVGCAERSVRRVKGVYAPGVGGVYGGDAGADKARKPTGMEESLTGALTRVVLEPWIDWDDMGVAIEYRVPRVCGPRDMGFVEEDVKKDVDKQLEILESTNREEERERLIQHRLKRIEQDRARYAHDASVDDIVILVEPRVAEGMSVGMGLLGTWVQVVPVPPPTSPFLASGSGTRGRGRGRGGARGGRGGNARGGGPGGSSMDQIPKRESTFWYIEDMHMAIPSFWTVPKKDVPGSLMAENEELSRMFYEAIEEGDVVREDEDGMDEFMG